MTAETTYANCTTQGASQDLHERAFVDRLNPRAIFPYPVEQLAELSFFCSSHQLWWIARQSTVSPEVSPEGHNEKRSGADRQDPGQSSAQEIKETVRVVSDCFD